MNILFVQQNDVSLIMISFASVKDPKLLGTVPVRPQPSATYEETMCTNYCWKSSMLALVDLLCNKLLTKLKSFHFFHVPNVFRNSRTQVDVLAFRNSGNRAKKSR